MSLMRASVLVVVLTLTGCATAPPASQRSSEKSAANAEPAQEADYWEVIGPGGSKYFCPRDPDIGFHIIPGCMDEATWNRKHREKRTDSGEPSR